MSVDPNHSDSARNTNDPLTVVDEDDPGDDMQRRVRYQACVAATYALALLQNNSEHITVYCEHHDDFLLVKRDGSLEAFQVKTRAEGRTPLKANDDGVLSALARFALKDREYPSRFEKFVIYTNGDFWKEKKDRYNLSHLLEVARTLDTDAALADRAVKSFVAGIISAATKSRKGKKTPSEKSVNSETVLLTLRKTYAHSGASLDDAESRVIRAVLRQELLHGHPAITGENIAQALIAFTARAASRPADTVALDMAALAADPADETQQVVIRQKRITAESILAVFAEHGIRAPFQQEGNIISPSTAGDLRGNNPLSPAQIPEVGAPVEYQAGLLAFPAISPTTTSLNQDEAAAEAQFEVIRSLSDSGHPRAALDAVTTLRERYWAKVSLMMRAKIANCQATVAFRLDDLHTAHRFLDEARRYAPRNSVILTNLASVFLLMRQPEKALEYAVLVRQLEPSSENAAAIYLQALYSVGQEEQLDAELADESNAWMEVSPVCLAALASIARARGEYERAKLLLLEVMKDRPPEKQDPQHLMLLGSVIVMSVSQRIIGQQREPGRLTPEERSELIEAQQVYDNAIDIFVTYDSRNWLHSALVSRSGVRFLLGDFDGALKDCERVVGDAPTDWSALENKGRTLLAMNCFEESASVLENLWLLLPEVEAKERAEPALYKSNRTGQDRRDAILYDLALAYTQSAQANKVLDLLAIPADGFASFGTTLSDFQRAELLLYAASDLPDESAKQVADQALDYLRAKWDTDPKAHAVVSQYHANRHEGDEAIKEMRQAVDLADEPLKSKYQRVLARLLYETQEYPEATSLFRTLLADVEDDPFLPAFVYSLYQSGQYKEALMVAKKVRSIRGVKTGVSDIEAELLEKEGNLPEARRVLTELVAVDPDAHQYRVRLAFLEIRDGNREIATAITEAILYDDITGRPDLLMNVAILRSKLRMPDILRFGYRAQRLASDDAEIRSRYMDLFNDLDSSGDEGREQYRERTSIEVGDGVILERGSTTVTFIIEPEEPVSATRHEIAPDDDRAIRLIGRSKGDKITLPGAFTESDAYEIIDIQHRYLFAIHEMIRQMSNGSLTHPRMQAFPAERPEDIERVLNAMSKGQKEKPEPWSLYATQPLPLVALARLLNCSVVDLWLAISGSSQAAILAFTRYSKDEQEQFRVLYEIGDAPISLDITALLTIAHLGIGDLVRSRFKRVLVSQAVLDHLVEYEQQTRGMMGTTTVSLPDKSHYLLSSADRDAVVQRLLSLARGMEVVPTRGLLEADEKYVRFFGTPTLAAMLTAQEHRAVLYADDFRVRQFALTVENISSVDSQMLLADLRRGHGMTREEHASAQATLARSNYRQVYMDSDLLLTLLDVKGNQIDDDVRAALALFMERRPHSMGWSVKADDTTI